MLLAALRINTKPVSLVHKTLHDLALAYLSCFIFFCHFPHAAFVEVILNMDPPNSQCSVCSSYTYLSQICLPDLSYQTVNLLRVVLSLVHLCLFHGARTMSQTYICCLNKYISLMSSLIHTCKMNTFSFHCSFQIKSYYGMQIFLTPSKKCPFRWSVDMIFSTQFVCETVNEVNTYTFY